MTYDRNPSRAPVESREKGSNIRSYKISSRNATDLRKYKNGVSGKRRFMTEGDFATYYKATREYTPEANVELDTTILLQKIDRARYKKESIPVKTQKNDIKKKLREEADRNNPKKKGYHSERQDVKKTNVSKSASSNIKRMAKQAAKEWIPLEERHEERIVEGSKTKLPMGVIFAIIVITVSLLLIVGSSVLLGSARNEQNELKEAIEDLDFEIAELNTELNKRNESIDIEYFAERVLGMIKQEHVTAEYVQSNKTDGVEKHETSRASFASLIQWIFQSRK